MNVPKILLIDDDPVVRSLISNILRKKGYEVVLAKEGQEGLELARSETPDLVITDYQMPGISGIEVLSRMHEVDPQTPVIILTAYGDATLTIKSIQTGAFDFIEKPINPRELLETVKNGLSTLESVRQKEGPGILPERKKDGNVMVGKSPAMREIFKNIGRISQNNVNVMITGDSGAGKERMARLIHESGYNKDQPLAYINCKILAEQQLQDGQGGGGVHAGISGRSAMAEKLKQAGSGTVILDEVGMLSSQMQMYLLDRMSRDDLEESRMWPRFISITTQDISDLVSENLFLKELYYKLKVFSLHIPPLRERKTDIPELVKNLLQELNPELDKKVVQLEDGVVQLLQSHDWPGNVRELKNVLMQALVLSHGEVLEKKHIRLEGKPVEVGKDEVFEEQPRSMDEVEKEHIEKVLKYTRWNKQQASSILGITRPTLNAKIDKYGLKKI